MLKVQITLIWIAVIFAVLSWYITWFLLISVLSLGISIRLGYNKNDNW